MLRLWYCKQLTHSIYSHSN